MSGPALAPPAAPPPARAPRAPIAWPAVAAQSAAVALVAALLVLVAVTTAANLELRGIPTGFEFLGDRAGFKIADTVIAFSPDHSYLRAIAVGVGNTLFLSLIVCLAATVVGALLGVARLSANPLVAALAAVWVEAVRNTPPVLLLIFLYALWSQAMPVGGAQEVLPGIVASVRGVAVPKLETGLPAWAWAAALLASLTAPVLASRAARRRTPSGARRPPYGRAVLAAVALAWVAAALLGGWSLELPRAAGEDLAGGARLTPEFATVVFGLTVYTAGFIAEIVRSGIEAIPRGQWEAGRALGLSEGRILRLVVAPQTLRVITPPMTSQYINTVKNSTLAIAIGYSEFMTVMGTVINRTNQPLEGTLVIVAVYMAINLALAAGLDLLNRRVQPEQR
ncbi:MAG: ABC transporter permease subunit [Phenylobacterium sp.]|uniref:ABC transporter permease subunit n=1 Tax=Phenylobacterium sp. TaxID=1871053 RepID=UPI0011FCBBEF|nr:ABC transporter permease subunit [Phenylobacterium sp.]TAJ71780.1 MAG: ABC transporter permease subunit [Phenylobacterium sp.]